MEEKDTIELEEERVAESYYILARIGDAKAFSDLRRYSCAFGNVYRPAAQYRLGLLLSEGVEIYGRVIIEKNVEEAIKLLKEAVEKGHNEARLALANVYIKEFAPVYLENGKPKIEYDVEIGNIEDIIHFKEGFNLLYTSAKNGYDKSLERLQELANFGYGEAHYYLGRICYDKRDFEGAVKHFKIAAEKGCMDNEAQFELGKMYYYAEGVEKDDHEAVKYISRATASDEAFYFLKNMADEVAEAAYYIAVSYKEKAEFFLSIEDLTEAIKYMQMAANGGIKEAQYEAGNILTNSFIMKPVSIIDEAAILNGTFTLSEQRRKKYEEVAKLYLMAIAQENEEELYQGHADEKYVLGMMYYYGIGVEQDYAEALKYYKMAACQGHVEAQYKVEFMYYHGEGVESNDSWILVHLRPHANDNMEKD